MTRDEFERKLVAEARSWLGVGFLTNGRTKSQGTDCLGLVLCVYGALGFRPGAAPAAYRADWYDHAPSDPYFDRLLAESEEAPRGELAIGDVPLFAPGRLARGRPEIVSHVGLHLGGGQFIHCRNGKGVEEADLSRRAWAAMYVGARRPMPLVLLREKVA